MRLMNNADHQPTSPPARLGSSRHFLAWCFALFATLVALSGFIFFQYQKQTIVTDTRTKLTIVAQQKANQLHYWRCERQRQGEKMARDKQFLAAVSCYLARPEQKNDQSLHTFLSPELHSEEIRAILLLDNHARLLWCSASQRIDDCSAFMPTDKITRQCFSRIYTTTARGFDAATDHSTLNLNINLYTPLHSDKSATAQPRATLVFVLNPAVFLLSAAEHWPVENESARSTLVRIHNNRVEPIKTYADNHVIDTDIPAAHEPSLYNYVLQRHEGFISDSKCSGVPVYAMIKRVGSSDWFIVCQINQSEVLRPLILVRTLVIGTVLSIIIAAGAMLWFWWRHQQAHSKTRYYQQELQHRTLSMRFENLTRFANDIIVLCDQEGNIIDANDRAVEAYGLPIEELRNQKLRAMCNMEEAECNILWGKLSQQKEISFSSHQFRRDGTTFPVEISASWIEIDNQRLLQAVIRDVSEREEAEKRLIHQSNHDQLTGLINRTRVVEQIDKMVDSSTRMAVLFIDLDRFKNINDTLGHGVGDKLLTRIANRLQRTLRQTDVVARFGGDEFVVLLADIRDVGRAAALAQKLCDTIKKPLFIDGQELYVTCSCGISIAPDDSSDPDQLISFADTAMFRAKDLGRNNFQFYSPDMNHRASERLQLETDLRKALERGELVVYYQPQVDLRSGAIIGSEALVRWNHPRLGLVPPGDFIPLAEETGIIEAIGMWVLEAACRQNVIWQQQGYGNLTVAVNLSPRQFINSNLAGDIFAVMHATGIQPQHLELELTENLLMHDVESSHELMHAFSVYGISLAIDDFGTGYSSLSYLHQFPIDKLKIDRSFVSPISNNSEGTIARSIIAMAHELGMRVVAEGIETEQQLSFLKHLNCQIGQGYYFSRPVPASDFTRLLQQQD